MGLKSGGTVKERAQRLYLTKTTPLEQLDKKHFAKGVVLPGAQAGQGKTEADAKKAEEGALQVRGAEGQGEGEALCLHGLQAAQGKGGCEEGGGGGVASEGAEFGR